MAGIWVSSASEGDGGLQREMKESFTFDRLIGAVPQATRPLLESLQRGGEENKFKGLGRGYVPPPSFSRRRVSFPRLLKLYLP